MNFSQPTQPSVVSLETARQNFLPDLRFGTRKQGMFRLVRAFSSALLLVLAVFIFGNSALFAAPILFKTPVTINATNSTNTAVSDADIFTLGTAVFAYNFFGASTVNGVSFASTNSTTGTGNLGISLTGATYFAGYCEVSANVLISSGPLTNLSSGYLSLIRAGVYADGTNTMNVSLNGLTAGRAYAVQLWGNESRNFTGSYDRSDIVTSAGGNSVILDFNWANQVGGVGQYVLGTFVAASTSQAFTLQGTTVSSGASTQINAIQLRDVTDAIGIWTGAVNGSWDNTTANWSGGANFSTYALLPTGMPLKFQDTNGSGQTVTNPAITLASGGFTNVGSVNFTAGTLNYTLASASGTVGLGGTAALNKSGAGTLTLSGTHSFTGGVNLTGGTLLAASLGALPNGPVTVSAGAKLDLGGFDQTIALLTNNGTVANTGGAPANLTLTNGFAGTGVFAGSINLAVANNTSSYSILSSTPNVAGQLSNKGTGSGVTPTFYTTAGVGAGAIVFTGSLGSGVTKIVQDAPNSPLVIDATNTAFAGGAEVRQGALVVANQWNGVTADTGTRANQLGTGTISLGTGSASASLIYAARYGQATPASNAGGNGVINNPILVGGSGTNVINVTDYGFTLGGPITLNNNLTLASGNTNGSTMTVTGGVTGTGNITASNSSGSGTGSSGSYFLFTTNPVNNLGAVTFNNAAVLGGVAGTGTGGNIISGGVGPNVTAITQASGTNPLTIQTGSVNVGASGLAINTTAGAAVTFSAPTTGVGGLTLNLGSTGNFTLSSAFTHTGGTTINANSATSYTFSNALAGAGGLTLRSNSTSLLTVSGALNFAGTLTNSGTGNSGNWASSSGTPNGSVLLTGALGSGVTKVVQDSATSSLVLYANNSAFTGPVEIRQGVLTVANNSGTVTNVLGSGVNTITLGTSAANATLVYAGRSGISGATNGGGNYTLTNPITVAGTGTNMIAVTDWGLTLSSGITLNSNLTLALANSGGSALTLNGAVTGQGNLTLTNSSASSALSSFVLNQVLNNVGSINFANTAVLGGVAGTASAPITINGGIGSNVTSINQNGINAVTIQTGSVNVNPAGLAFNLNTGTGITASAPTTGSGAITININSTGSMTLSGAIGHTGGTFINRNGGGSFTINNLASAPGPLNFGGTATSALTYAGALGASVPSVTQSGAGALTLSGAVTVGATGKNLVVAGAGAMTLSGAMSGTGDLVLQPDGSGVLTLSNAVNITGSIINIGTGSTVALGTVTSIATKGAAILNGVIGANVTKVIQNSPTSSLVLNATNTGYAGPVEIQSGALVFGSPTKNGITSNSSSADMAGTGLITVGTGAADAALIYAGEFGGGNGGNATIGNDITISGSGMNLIATPNWALIVTGTLNLDSADLTLGQCNPGNILGIYGWLTFNGGVTGIGNITATNSAGSANPYIEFNTLPVNHAGGLTFNNGSILGAPAGTGTGINKITGGVGSNVQFITQASNSNPLTISGGSVTVNPAGLVLNSTGTALLTVSAPTTGSGQLTLNSSSTGGITLSGALGHTGGLVINVNGAASPMPSISSLATYTKPITYQGSSATAQTLSGAYVTGSLSNAMPNAAMTFSGGWSLPASGGTLSAIYKPLTYSGVISGTGPLNIQGQPGTVIALTGTNTFTGGVTITSGTLSVATITNGSLASNLGAATAAANLLKLNGGNLQYTGTSASTDRAFYVTADSSIEVTNAATTLTLVGNAQNNSAFGLTKLGAGTLLFANPNTFGGSLTIKQGTVINNNVYGLGTNGTNQVNLGDNTGANTASLFGNNLITVANPIVLGTTSGTLTVGNTGTGNNLVYSGGITGTNNLTIANNSGTGTLTFQSGSIAITGSLLSAGTGTGDTIISAPIVGAVSVVQNSATSRLILCGTNSYAGATIVNAGTLVFDGPNASPVGSPLTVASGATVMLRNGAQVGSFSGAGTVIYEVGSAVTIGANGLSGNVGAILSGSSTLTKSGNGTITLTGSNTYTGATTINGGTLVAGGTQAFGTNSPVTLANAVGTTLNLNGYSISIGGLLGGGSLGGNVVLGNGTLTVKTLAGYLPNYFGTISGSGGVVVSGSGTQVFAGLNTYTGVTTLSGGILSIDSIANGGLPSELGAASSAPSNLVFAGGTLLYSGAASASTDRGMSVSSPYSATISVANGVSLSLNGVIAGSGAFSVSGNGTIVLAGNNTFTGKTSVTSGALSVLTLNKVTAGATSSSLGAPTTTLNGTIDLGSLSNAGTLIVTGSAQTTDRLINLAGTTGGGVLDQSGSGTLLLTGSVTATGAGVKTLTLQGSTFGDAQISGIIANNSASNTTAILKQGSGKWTLSGANTYSGSTKLTQGVLALGGTGALGTGSLTISGGSLDASLPLTMPSLAQIWSGSFSFVGSNALDLSAGSVSLAVTPTVTVNGGSLTVANITAGTAGFGISKDGIGTLVVAGTGNYVGGTRLLNGSLVLGSGSALGTGTLFISPGATLDVRTALVLNALPQVWGGSFTFQGSNSLDASASSVTLTADSMVTVSASTLTVGGVSGNFAFGKAGNGTLILSGTNTYTGATNILAAPSSSTGPTRFQPDPPCTRRPVRRSCCKTARWFPITRAVVRSPTRPVRQQLWAVATFPDRRVSFCREARH
jgi:fibronectin-binding autotransporter adhesin